MIMNANLLWFLSMGAAISCFLFSLIELYHDRTDWMAIALGLGLMGLSLIFAYLRMLELKFDKLTQVLADTFRKLSEIEHQNHAKFNSGPTHVHGAFYFSGGNISHDSGEHFDSMSLEQLETERRKAEKAEDYEKAAQIQRRIDQKKRQ